MRPFQALFCVIFSIRAWPVVFRLHIGTGSQIKNNSRKIKQCETFACIWVSGKKSWNFTN